MMSQDQKREMIEAIHPRYLKAITRGKEQTLDEFIVELKSPCNKLRAFKNHFKNNAWLPYSN